MTGQYSSTGLSTRRSSAPAAVPSVAFTRRLHRSMLEIRLVKATLPRSDGQGSVSLAVPCDRTWGGPRTLKVRDDIVSDERHLLPSDGTAKNTRWDFASQLQGT